MEYQIIDRDAWPQRQRFEHYLSAVPCAYSMTVRLDITHIRSRGLRLYPALLHLLTGTVNRHAPFRYAFRKSGELVLYSSLEPCYTVFHKETGTFSNLWTRYSQDYDRFLADYEADLTQYGQSENFFPKPGMPENCFTVSMLPWASFESFQLHTGDLTYLLPIFTLGRYSVSQGRYSLPLAVQVHHAVCDGFHLCRFLEDLQAQADLL